MKMYMCCNSLSVVRCVKAKLRDVRDDLELVNPFLFGIEIKEQV